MLSANIFALQQISKSVGEHLGVSRVHRRARSRQTFVESIGDIPCWQPRASTALNVSPKRTCPVFRATS